MKTLTRVIVFFLLINILLYPLVLRDEKIQSEQLNKIKKNPRITNNNIDLRYHEVSTPPPPGTIKIFLIGSSIAQDFDLPIEKSTAYLLEKELQQRLGKPVKVYNLAKKGTSVLDDYFIFQQALHYQQPDFVIWAFYPNADFSYRTALTISRWQYQEEPRFLLQNFSYLDPIFYFEQSNWEKELKGQPFQLFLIKRNLFIEKLNFIAGSFVHQLPVYRFFFYRQLRNSYLGGKKASDSFYATLQKKYPEIPPAKKQKSKVIGAFAPNTLSDLAIKFISECRERNIALIVYNHPARPSTFNGPYYKENLQYMQNYFHQAGICYVQFPSWNLQYFRDWDHFNEKGTARLAPLLAEKIAPFIEQKLAHNKTGGKQ